MSRTSRDILEAAFDYCEARRERDECQDGAGSSQYWHRSLQMSDASDRFHKALAEYVHDHAPTHKYIEGLGP